MSQHYVICSDHFIASEFVDDSKQRLKKRAIPTLFDFSSQNGVPVEIIDGDQIIVEGKCICEIIFLFLSSFGTVIKLLAN